MYPSLLARMVNQVGSPAMFDGNMFLPETGTPIWKMDRIRTLLAVWLPEPLTVATCMEKSLMTGWAAGGTPTGDVAAEDNRRDLPAQFGYLGSDYRLSDTRAEGGLSIAVFRTCFSVFNEIAGFVS